MHWSSSPIFWSQPLYSEHVLVCCLGPSSCNIGKSGVVVHFTQKSLVHSRSSITPWFTVLIEKDLYDCSSLTTFSWLTHTFWRRSDHRKPYISKGHFTLNLVFDIGFLSKTRVVISMLLHLHSFLKKTTPFMYVFLLMQWQLRDWFDFIMQWQDNSISHVIDLI